ncbi:NAD(P)-dependent dehydrogenase (short-subunit alcohol dehydrogenase family) [Bacillus pakistanensis]|uniref:NAD(P)-dependent dehydrogenase (Short-subunit alcohol dehydrogenase family) n=1 Tax=Rossellomorea pakistanensis TaxID=992288 RepID=A0ABS2NH55_9BACI|nr:SDR family NAD(P)-dependent oxidoreductase [Bacillus pakistanensis]MBM7587165.1 NAD(P)-dependent dehydrogenase (short-subunit alcohol dehydrogenase family) [Bacillus pakistanensis]
MKNSVAIVTGAGSERGIGKAIASELAKKGATVIIADLNVKGANKVADKLKKNGYKAVGKEVDVTSRLSIDHLMESVRQDFGKIDILINNAGIARPTKILEITEEEWDLLFAINMRGVFHCTQAVLPSMIEQSFGRIINISSLAGKQGGGVFGTSHYAATKAGILGFSKAVAREVAEYGITVNSVAPGLIDTDITVEMDPILRQEKTKLIPLKRAGQPQEVAATVAFLASNEAGYITGEEIDVNGGLLMD